jgi:hypothetical protein
MTELLERQHDLLTREYELLSAAGSSPKPLLLRDELKAGAHQRNDAVQKALRREAGFFDVRSLQESQRLAKRDAALEAQSRRPQPRAFSSLEALVRAQKNSRKRDGFSGPAPGDARAGAQEVMATDRAMPQSYSGYEPSRRADSFNDILPGGPALSDPTYDPYPDSATNFRPWVTEGGTPMTQADALRRPAAYRGPSGVETFVNPDDPSRNPPTRPFELGIKLFAGESSAFFKPATPMTSFGRSGLVVRTQSREAPRKLDVNKLAAALRRGPKVFGKNLF